MIRGIILVSNRSATIKRVTAALSSNGELQSGNILNDLHSMAARLELQPAPIALIDLGVNELRMLQELGPIVSHFKQIRFVGISESDDRQLLLKAMQVGMRGVLSMAHLEHELHNTLQDVVGNHANNKAKGRMIALLSASGGCGATTLAVNLAHELSEPPKGPAMLIDLDAAYGAVAVTLGINGHFGIADVLARYAQTDNSSIDTELIHSTAQSYSKHLSVLLSPASTNPTAPSALNLTHLNTAIEASRQIFAYTVVDAPRLPLNVTSQLAAQSQVTFIVLQLCVKDVRMAQAMIQGLERHGVSRKHIVVLVNRYKGRKQTVTLEQIQQLLQDVRVETICNDFPSALRGLDVGQPLGIAAPRSYLRKDISRLTEKVAAGELGVASTLPNLVGDTSDDSIFLANSGHRQ